MDHSTIAGILTGFNSPATGAASITLTQQNIGPLPHQSCCGLHSNVLHHPQINCTEGIQTLPLVHEWIIRIHQKGVIKLVAKLLIQGAQAGEVDHKATGIQLRCGKPEGETTAVAMHEPAMARMTPLPMAAGVTLKQLAAAESGGGVKHAVLQRTG